MLVCEVCGRSVIPGKDFGIGRFLLSTIFWSGAGATVGAILGAIIGAAIAPSTYTSYLGREYDYSGVGDMAWMFAAGIGFCFGLIAMICLALSTVAKPPTVCPIETTDSYSYGGNIKHHVYRERVIERVTVMEEESDG